MAKKLLKYCDIKQVFQNMGIDDSVFRNPRLKEDLELDSQEFVEFIIELENILEIDIQDGILENSDTISSVLIKINNYIYRYNQERFDSVEINADLADVKQAIWDLTSWEKKLGHIKSVKIMYQENDYQEFWMEVLDNNGDVAVTAESNRFLYENIIYFCQPTPPTYLLKHGGYWEFKKKDNKTEIILHHQWVESENAKDILGCKDEKELHDKISDMLKTHANATLLKWKDILDEN